MVLKQAWSIKNYRYIGDVSVAQIKKCSTNESLDITWGICTRNSRSKRYTENFYGATLKTVSGQQHPQILPRSN
jgi:hypothetical protein